MKPISFDLTPLAQALQVARPKEEVTVKQERSLPADERSLPTTERVGHLPRALRRGTWPSTLAQEQIHALATHVLARNSEQAMRTIALTSALAGEGKTTITLALGEKLATSGRKVLVIDLDTHRGTLSLDSKLDQVPGAIESSSGSGEGLPFHVYSTDCPGLKVMPTGQVDNQDGVPLLSPDRIKRIVTRALSEYDIVLLDCPPLLPVADTHVVGEVVDSAILVIRANSTPQPILLQALEEFGKDKFFAAVLNRAQPYMIPYFREVYGYYRRSKNRPGN